MASDQKRNLVLSKVYGLLEPGPVVLLTTAHKGLFAVATETIKLPSKMR